MASLEQPCYTLIHASSDSEQPSEMQLKQDLGMLIIILLFFISIKKVVQFFQFLVLRIWFIYLFFSENGDIPTKTSALKKTIQLILSGERLPGILMTVIRFVMPLEDHTIKKLLLVFWEIVPKTTGEGKLLQEMILVCDAYRKVRCSFKVL